MKKVFVLLVLAFVFLSCDADKMSNQELLIGTWEDTWEDEEGDLLKDRYVFTENEFTHTGETYIVIVGISKEPYIYQDSGFYSLNNNVITFNIKSIDGKPSNYLVSTEISITKSTLSLKSTKNGETYTYKRIN